MPKTLNLASWRVEPYTIDSITVLRGPTSVLYGQGDPGAIVDVQSKLANGDRIREIEVQVGNYARKQLAFDIGDTANNDGTLSYRLIGVGRDGNSQTGPNKDGRIAFTPSLRWQPSAATSLTLSATYLDDRSDIASNFLPAQGMVLHNPNGRISRDVYTGEPDFNYYRKKRWSLGYAFEHKPDSTWTLRQNVRLMHSQLNNRSVWGGGLDASDRTMASISRYAGIFQFNYSRFDIDNQAEAKFRTGGLQHTLLAGLEYNRQSTTDSEMLAQAPSLNLYNPPTAESTIRCSMVPTRSPHRHLHHHEHGRPVPAGPDQVRALGAHTGRPQGLGPHQADRPRGRYPLVAAGPGLQRPRRPDLSGRLRPVALHQLLDLVQSGGQHAPGQRRLGRAHQGKQIEAGLRWQPDGENLTLNAAVYQIKQTNVLTPNLDDPPAAPRCRPARCVRRVSS